TERLSGVMIGAGFEVRYHVKAPRGASFNISNTNGQISLNGLTGKVVAHTTNGGVRGRSMAGPVEARTTNGGVDVDMASVGTQPITLGCTNGGVVLRMPDSAKADISATWTNGGVNVSGVKMDVTERSRRRLEAKM